MEEGNIIQSEKLAPNTHLFIVNISDKKLEYVKKIFESLKDTDLDFGDSEYEIRIDARKIKKNLTVQEKIDDFYSNGEDSKYKDDLFVMSDNCMYKFKENISKQFVNKGMYISDNGANIYYEAWGNEFIDKEKYESAFNCFRLIENTRSKYWCAYCLEKLDRTMEAIARYYIIKDIEEKAKARLANLYIEVCPDKAIKIYTDLVVKKDITLSDRYDYYLKLAQCYENKKQVADEIRVLNDAMSINPNNELMYKILKKAFDIDDKETIMKYTINH
jgi:tetratricopeptide (TPR) repeat protein